MITGKVRIESSYHVVEKEYDADTLQEFESKSLQDYPQAKKIEFLAEDDGNKRTWLELFPGQKKRIEESV